MTQKVTDIIRSLNKIKKENKDAIVFHYTDQDLYIRKVTDVVVGYIKEDERNLATIEETRIYSKKEVEEQGLENMIPIVVLGNR